MLKKTDLQMNKIIIDIVTIYSLCMKRINSAFRQAQRGTFRQAQCSTLLSFLQLMMKGVIPVLRRNELCSYPFLIKELKTKSFLADTI